MTKQLIVLVCLFFACVTAGAAQVDSGSSPNGDSGQEPDDAHGLITTECGVEPGERLKLVYRKTGMREMIPPQPITSVIFTRLAGDTPRFAYDTNVSVADPAVLEAMGFKPRELALSFVVELNEHWELVTIDDWREVGARLRSTSNRAFEMLVGDRPLPASIQERINVEGSLIYDREDSVVPLGAYFVHPYLLGYGRTVSHAVKEAGSFWTVCPAFPMPMKIDYEIAVAAEQPVAGHVVLELNGTLDADATAARHRKIVAEAGVDIPPSVRELLTDMTAEYSALYVYSEETSIIVRAGIEVNLQLHGKLAVQSSAYWVVQNVEDFEEAESD